MRNKKIIAGLMSLAIVFGSGAMMINAEETNNNTTTMEDRCCPPSHGQHMKRGKEIFDNSVDELKKSGVLDDKDIKNIENYNTKKMEEMKKKRHSRIDEMVEQNVITKEKGEKLKSTIDKNIEAERKANDK
ncbi:hypothetical protein CHL78_002080 [Romboutsia weinsteinii]|uniref:Uncharacterized protein n=1 Tax=Romboutsia weinsteinii TaxID=2020949 RepID=A0A371J8W7_9FIRM|nr:hypothetical protein [Romboutsia weinsteinii]RDY29116.1 hypothetical protein CHL78_002080 [Romboutsia weinsteinii]